MRRSPLFVVIVVALLLAVVAAGCVGAPSSGGAAPFAVDATTFPVITYARSGGPENRDQRAVLYLDGHVVLQRAGGDPITFHLSPAEQSQIDAAFEAANFFENARTALTPTPVPEGEATVEINRRGLMLQGTLTTGDETAPDWAAPLIPLLDNLLLSPDPAEVQAWQPDQPAATATPRSAAASTAPALVLIEFTRRTPAGEERVLLNLDRTYSVARGGAIREGALDEGEMAALLKVVEAANLRQRAGDYLDDGECPDCVRYELVYRNLFGQHTVRTADGQVPDWLLPAIDTLTAQFLGEAPAPLAGATPQATAAPTDAPGAAAAPTITPTIAPGVTTTVAVTPTTPAAASALPYSSLDLLAELANLGVQVEIAPGRVVKPWLSTYGVIVRVDGEPVQVFQYADEAALTADVDGLDAGAASIDGLALSWPATPHFWRKDGLLVLAVTDEEYFVDLLSQILGVPFVGG